jgi:hypothetical protein
MRFAPKIRHGLTRCLPWDHILRMRIWVTCLFALSLGCASANPVRRDDENEHVGVVSSQLRMRDMKRESKEPGTLSLVDPEGKPHAAPTVPAAVSDHASPEASRESLRQLGIPNDLRAQRTAIDACYQRALRDDPRLAGTLELAVHVARDGAVGKVKVRRDTVRHAGLRKCVARAVSELRTLPETVEGPEVTYPVTFGGSTSELL